jgi:hypothetical protein
MDAFLEARRPRDRSSWRLSIALAETREFSRRRRCEGCGLLRICGLLELLVNPEHWYCLSSCWRYQTGVLHGRRSTLRELGTLIEAFTEKSRS